MKTLDLITDTLHQLTFKGQFVDGKTVTIKNIQIQLPIWAKFIAIDSDGDVHAYSEKPLKNNTQWYKKPGTKTQLIGEVKDINTFDELSFKPIFEKLIFNVDFYKQCEKTNG